MSTNTPGERKPDITVSLSSPIKKRNAIKRLLMLLSLSICLLFAGAQSAPITQASVACDMECNEYIDPFDGQCYQVCCPANEECKIRCVLMPCKADRGPARK